MSDDEILSNTSSSPLSAALDTAVLEASFYATDGTAGLTSESPDILCVKSGGKVYLCVDHTANQRKGSAPSWTWALLIGKFLLRSSD